ncbi:MAG TPA: DNA-protecting protein DprA [Gammaproteobacteria bacterium]|nr:DNA-protecting protein DprA [Gammaproteobacteria bacterium]
MNTTSPDLDAWLALAFAPGLGERRILRLLEHFGSAQAVCGASAASLHCAGLDDAIIEALHAPEPARLDTVRRWLEGDERHLLTLHDPRYPRQLRNIPDPPPLLFVQGDPDCLAVPQLAMVGSRNPTPGGRETANEFAAHLSALGIAITSGLASGIDAAAHAGALEGIAGTVAVTGTGPDRVYPAENRELAHRIAAHGALVTEFAPGTPPLPGNFPRRNRIIAGLSLGTLVVEAALRSGSLITARLAREQGREVFAIPGSIHNPLARGCHALIREGAKLVETARHVLEELAGQIEIPAETAPETGHSGQPPELSDDYRELLELVGFEPVSMERLVARSGLTPEALSSMLLMLELEGHLVSSPGGYYARAR